MIQSFGSLRGITCASPTALADAIRGGNCNEDMLVAAIIVARDINMLAAREALYGEPTEPGNPRLRQYLVRRLGPRHEECVLVLFLTAEGLFIAEDFYAGAHCNTARLPLRRTVRRAFDLDARRLVIAHNHPSGNPEPSAADIRATRHFGEIVGALDLELDDHVVIGWNRTVSFRERGLI
ncbi:DNA repair protein RadC [Novosphingobium sp. PhB165]|uniref:JAB domain-containing protein n=1 Tax=Novosphingobium sp. PhB165 TaxID=2485105 RepID=UPI0010535E80|nr:JAB domain-containing protein [Novosphingobium sp. PhB165]TCM22406.1 DNA repair protein RadC [Novosphingobium sp. PhB165]